MARRKVYNKVIILFSTFCLTSVSLFAQYDFSHMRLGAEVNGKQVCDKVVLHDNDTCTFFLMDKNGNKVTYLPSEKNYSFEWNLKFPTISGGTRNCRINTTRYGSIIGIKITPTGLFERNFADTNANPKDFGYRVLYV